MFDAVAGFWVGASWWVRVLTVFFSVSLACHVVFFGSCLLRRYDYPRRSWYFSPLGDHWNPDREWLDRQYPGMGYALYWPMWLASWVWVPVCRTSEGLHRMFSQCLVLPGLPVTVCRFEDVLWPRYERYLRTEAGQDEVQWISRKIKRRHARERWWCERADAKRARAEARQVRRRGRPA